MSLAPKVLIVDDEPALLKMLGVYLIRMGYRVETLDSTDRAWAAVEASPGEFAVAVLDATMRGMTTNELAIKLLAANPAMRVLVASGYPVDLDDLEMTAPGRVKFVQKPFTAETLANTLRRLIGPEE